LQPSERLAIGASSGLLIVAVSGPSQDSGIQPGDVLISINGKQVMTVEQVRTLVTDTAALLVQRGEEKVFIAIRSSTKSR
jgi:serine protease Do